MANSSFPAPKYTTVPEKNDKQIVSVPLENAGWGARTVSTGGKVKNEMNIKHTGGSKGEG